MKLILLKLLLSAITTGLILMSMYIAATQFTYNSFFQALAALVVPPIVIVYFVITQDLK